jgi:hypothetical protein
MTRITLMRSPTIVPSNASELITVYADRRTIKQSTARASAQVERRITISDGRAKASDNDLPPKALFQGEHHNCPAIVFICPTGTGR